MASSPEQGTARGAAASQTVCARCRAPLDFHHHPDQRGYWAHTANSAADHPVVPVDRDKTGGEVVGRCDFCSTPHPTWSYPCGDFQVGRAGFSGPWAACGPCHILLMAGELHLLAARATATTNAVDVERRRAMRRDVEHLHLAFLGHRTGPAVPL